MAGDRGEQTVTTPPVGIFGRQRGQGPGVGERMLGDRLAHERVRAGRQNAQHALVDSRVRDEIQVVTRGTRAWQQFVDVDHRIIVTAAAGGRDGVVVASMSVATAVVRVTPPWSGNGTPLGSDPGESDPEESRCRVQARAGLDLTATVLTQRSGAAGHDTDVENELTARPTPPCQGSKPAWTLVRYQESVQYPRLRVSLMKSRMLKLQLLIDDGAT